MCDGKVGYILDQGTDVTLFIGKEDIKLPETVVLSQDPNFTLDAARAVFLVNTGNIGIVNYLPEKTPFYQFGPPHEWEWSIPSYMTTKLNGPFDIAIDSTGNVYVADTYNHHIQKFSPDGTFITKWGFVVEGDFRREGDGHFTHPIGISIDSQGYVYEVNAIDHCIQKFSPDGEFITTWDFFGRPNRPFGYPCDVSVDNKGYVYVVDSHDHNVNVQKFSPDGTFIIKCGSLGSSDGQFTGPSSISLDNQGNVYVLDSFNNRIQKFSPDGTFIIKCGSLGSGDGQFNGPSGISLDSQGNVYVADTNNHRIQKFSPDGTFLTKWGSEGSFDRQFNYPRDISVDSAGNVYVADTGNHRIQKFRYPILFIRGDADSDTVIDKDDAKAILEYLFLGGEAPCPLAAGDVDDTGNIDLTDPIYLLIYIYHAGPQPAAPFPEAGLDPTP